MSAPVELEIKFEKEKHIFPILKLPYGSWRASSHKFSALGELAGAGSILHQLAALGGTQDPLFSKAIFQSLGYLSLIVTALLKTLSGIL